MFEDNTAKKRRVVAIAGKANGVKIRNKRWEPNFQLQKLEVSVGKVNIWKSRRDEKLMDIGTHISLEKKQDLYAKDAAPSWSLNKRSRASSVKDV